MTDLCVCLSASCNVNRTGSDPAACTLIKLEPDDEADFRTAIAGLTHDRGPQTPAQVLLNDAVASGRVALVDALLAHGADPNQPNARGASMLFCACVSGHVTIAKRLLDGGANVDGTDAAGVHVLFAAVAHDDPTLIALLLAHGADAETSRPFGPLLHAMILGKCSNAALLLAHGADRWHHPNQFRHFRMHYGSTMTRIAFADL